MEKKQILEKIERIKTILNFYRKLEATSDDFDRRTVQSDKDELLDELKELLELLKKD